MIDIKLELIIPERCYNTLKRKIIRDLNIAFVKAGIPALTDLFHESRICEMIDGKTLCGSEAVTAFLHNLKEQEAKNCCFDTVLLVANLLQ